MIICQKSTLSLSFFCDRWFTNLCSCCCHRKRRKNGFSLAKRKLQVCQKNTFHFYESFCTQHCPSAQVSFGELLRLVRGGDVPLQIEMPTPLHSSSAYTNTHHTFSTWPENQRLPRDSHNPFETAVTAIEPTTSFFPQERRAGDEKKRRHTKWGIPKSHQGPNISLSLA